ncbi:MAG TPA: chromophore lyase CpcT/CpeT, partial [Planctomycetota bacterium]|nr:chromophore lyase CpcT/CpeT [Planctomycetota bacterium]
MKAAALLMFLTLFAGCQSAKGRQSSQLEHLAAAMTGTFSSAAQASVNPTYFPVQLVMHPIWTDRKDGHWLYVEQALETALDRPYRQRVYHVRTSGAGFASEVYELPGDLARFVGAFRDPAVFAG